MDRDKKQKAIGLSRWLFVFALSLMSALGADPG